MPQGHRGAALLAAVALLLATLAPNALAQPIDTTTKESLRAQTEAITNWDQFWQANNLSGWDFDTATTKAGFVHYCNWTGISCVNLAVTALELPCDSGVTGYCAVLAEGALAPELANISSLVALDFSGQRLAGALPAAYGRLSKLTRLLLPWNRFNSSIPPSWAEAGAFPQLETLDLANNRLAGPLPPAPNGSSLLPSLVTFLLDNNTLSSSLPASWGSATALPKLQQLYLLQNQLSGALPAEWASAGAFKALNKLELSDNKLRGPLPGNWGGAEAFPALAELSLGGNQLSGTLPEAWSCCGGFPSLSALSLTSNNLSGTLPPSWAPPAFPSLTGLQLDANPRLCGPVPDALYPAVCGNAESVATTCVGRELPACTADFPPASAANAAALLAQSAAITNWAEFASQNNITGWNASVPVCNWTGVTCTPQGSIIALDLGCEVRGYEGEVPPNCNGFAQGTLALELARISTLQQLILRNQQLAGTLPSEWGGSGAFANLNELQLHGNQLTGGIPAAWATNGSFPRLLILTLEQNRLGGTLPPQLGQGGSLAAVKFIDLSANRLSGPLPTSWSGLGFVTYLNLTDNNLNGTLPDSWGLDGGMPALTELYISVNRLGGELPTAWGDAPSFANLRRIELANNSIGGTLPPTYGSNGSLPVIGDMYLDHNQLSGTLPAEWGSPEAFQQLNTLSLDGNRLSGSIPTSWNVTGSFTALTRLALNGNPSLCDSTVPTLLQPAVCDSQATNCADGQISCQPTASPSPPPGGNEAAAEAGSSTPVGAIVGGVVGGIVLLAAAALLVVGRRRGWLSRSSLHKQLSTASRRGGGDFSLEDGNVKLVPSMDPGALSLLPAHADEAPLGMLPHSYISTMGRQVAAATARGTRGALINDTSSGSPSLHSLESDPVITFISTRLGTLSRRRPSGPPTSGDGTSRDTPSNNTPSGTAPSDGTNARPPSTNVSSQPTMGSGDTGNTSLSPDMQLWAVRWEQIQLERAIGRGSFGRVYLATWNATPTAVKVLISAEDLEQRQDLELPADIMQDLQEEAIVMSRMRHPNICAFFGLCTLPPCILTEYCSRGSVFDVLRQASWDADLAGQLTWRLRISMAYDAARGLLYLHMREPTIVHRDVKSPNLLVDEYWHVKVADFNLSQILAGQQGGSALDEGGATNPMWLAPEVLSFNAATTASDAYAMGLVMFELLAWRLPFVGLSPFQIRRKVLDGGRPEVPPLTELPGPDNDAFATFDDYCQLMRECWAQDPRRRPAFAEIVARLGAML
ncbi:Serine threonine- kinase CTR1 isoform B [Chlorella sorokiniana]|uniref:Serine threonine-kinase CTR1 isoform A n=1 Tax=Chlorella sorokiniana TaxID=3076 RepID=A0A2P6U584_CHLSO|nr:Serine threonine- kinase CTR1 isoform A [Chlorella sorokiniana]PRW61478.1 Serine threonine- kinase CTR1 isoform B [Chlorella sorokiniana]|eukprot:PRW61477.1 Serine threonine- kinase CTR1 isoform A [Chlorella sorokiniana]